MIKHASTRRDAALRPLVAQLVAQRQRELAARREESERRTSAIAPQIAAAGNLSIADINATPIGTARAVTTLSGRQIVWHVIDHAVTTR